MRRYKPLEERFWPKVNRNGPVPVARPDLGPCWLWTGGGDGRGYGHISAEPPNAKRKIKAHRVAWTLLVGPIPDGLEPDHLCRVTLCVRPSHLELVTHAENLARAPRSAVTIKREQTRCVKGHPLEQGPTQRRCPTCRREQNREANRRYRERRHARCS